MQANLLFPVLLWLVGGGMGIPVGIPPQPEDPLLSAVAPEQCLFYTSWAGTAAPDPKSKNHTEQLLAEPEVQRLLGEVETQIRKAIGKEVEPRGPEAITLANDGTNWVKTLITRPAAVFVGRAKLGQNGLDVQAGALVKLDGDAAAVAASIERQQKALLGNAAEKVGAEGTIQYRIQLGRGMPPVTWGVRGKYLIAAVGEGAMETILARGRGTPPAWLADIARQLPVQRRSCVSYVNLKGIMEMAVPMGGEKAQTVVEALGLTNVTSLVSVTGLEGEGFVSKNLLGIEGPPAGIFKVIADKPLTAADLDPIPRDATIAAAVRLAPDRILETALAIAGKVEPRAAGEVSRGLEGLKDELGIDLRQDVLQSLGDVWCLYNSPSEGGLVLTGLTAVVPVKDHAKLAKAHARLLEVVKSQTDRPPAKVKAPPGAYRPQPTAGVDQFPFAGQTIYWWNIHGRRFDFPVPVAWCLTEKELIVAAFPQNIKAYLSRGKEFQSLATAPEVAPWFTHENPPAGLFYQNTPEMVRLAYPLLQIGAHAISGELERQEGIRFDPALLPSAPALIRHLRPGVTVLRRTTAGLELTGQQSLPGTNVGMAVPLGTAVAIPAAMQARETARRVQSQNNVRQILLAMHNHHATLMRFPPAYKADATGKPLLSWRVLILPYLEHGNVYRQFHLDEPWDSEHNKKLISQMPSIYRSPQSNAGPGKTNYLTVRGPKTMFPGKERFGVADVTDGMSNTVAVVEANDQSAVIWTKPDDYEPDPQRPIRGLLGLQPGGFIAGFGDGSVRLLPATVDAETLQHLFDRDDNHAIPWDRLDPSGRRPAATKKAYPSEKYRPIEKKMDEKAERPRAYPEPAKEVEKTTRDPRLPPPVPESPKVPADRPREWK